MPDSTLVCILWYGDGSDFEVRSRADWMDAPFGVDELGVQVTRYPYPPLTSYNEGRPDALQDKPAAEAEWLEYGADFRCWPDAHPRPLACDWMEVVALLRRRGEITDETSFCEITLRMIRRNGVKVGLNLDRDRWEAIYQRAKRDPRIPPPRRRG